MNFLLRLLLAVIRFPVNPRVINKPIKNIPVENTQNDIPSENVIQLSDYFPEEINDYEHEFEHEPDPEELMKIAFISTDVLVADLLSRNSDGGDIIKGVSEGALLLEVVERIEKIQDLCEIISSKN